MRWEPHAWWRGVVVEKKRGLILSALKRFKGRFLDSFMPPSQPCFNFQEREINKAVVLPSTNRTCAVARKSPRRWRRLRAEG